MIKENNCMNFFIEKNKTWVLVLVTVLFVISLVLFISVIYLNNGNISGDATSIDGKFGNFVLPDSERKLNSDIDGDGFIKSIDCNDSDVGVGPATLYYEDSDSDGYGRNVGEAFCPEDVPLFGYVIVDGDCDDSNSIINPRSEEKCNGYDDDCDGRIDDVDEVDSNYFNDFYQDFDGDGYGNPSIITSACEAPTGYVSNIGDCNDTNANINPGVLELCGNGIDDDCSGVVDDC
ncbi:hypothetical protein HN385_03685 [archaeon]|jgi:hypothetical protein|nr:hypothetical protein [archaeon]MBT3451711.1 hypothetical protein [archaeon]MBT6869799.1 hypothetical protein [archaeon]MBT7192754.1 hypothetical protein [archaeon]MBT7380779.1 hypothetical protein [archaeon]